MGSHLLPRLGAILLPTALIGLLGGFGNCYSSSCLAPLGYRSCLWALMPFPEGEMCKVFRRTLIASKNRYILMAGAQYIEHVLREPVA